MNRFMNVMGLIIPIGVHGVAQEEPATRISANVGLPLGMGLEVERVVSGSVLGEPRLAPVAQISYLPISILAKPIFDNDASGIYYLSGTMAMRAYFASTAKGWFGFLGAGGILIHADAWDRPVYGRAYAVTIPVGLGWRGVWGRFTQLIEFGVDIPVDVEAVFAKSYSPPDGGRIWYADSIPVTRVVPRLALVLGWDG